MLEVLCSEGVFKIQHPLVKGFAQWQIELMKVRGEGGEGEGWREERGREGTDHSRIHDTLCHQFSKESELAAHLLHGTERCAGAQRCGEHAHRTVDVLGGTGSLSFR